MTATERARIARRRRLSGSTLVRVTAKPAQPPARYRAHCTPCKWSSREFTRYSTAETAARGHADERGHPAWVIDQYDLRVTGSTVRPGEGERA